MVCAPSLPDPFTSAFPLALPGSAKPRFGLSPEIRGSSRLKADCGVSVEFRRACFSFLTQAFHLRLHAVVRARVGRRCSP